MSKSFKAMRLKAEGWMRAGISPQRLALTLALGFAIGCIPVLGIPTALCLLVALPLRMNVPAMQAANYAAMPLQVILIFPFARLGGWMFASSPRTGLTADALMHGSALNLLWASGSLAGQAVAAWLVIAVPMVALMTLLLTAVLESASVLRGSCSAASCVAVRLKLISEAFSFLKHRVRNDSIHPTEDEVHSNSRRHGDSVSWRKTDYDPLQSRA